MAILKKVLSPIQKRLLSMGLCPACIMPLKKVRRYSWRKNEGILMCKCKRIYVFNNKTKKYRRTTKEEQEEFLNSKLKKTE